MNLSNFDIPLQEGQKISELCPLVDHITRYSASSRCRPRPNFVCGSEISEKLSLELEAGISPSWGKHECCILLHTVLGFTDQGVLQPITPS